MTSLVRTALTIAFGIALLFVTEAVAQRQMEKLGRGVIAVSQGEGEPILEAYRLDGTFMWRINLGKNR